ncbi:MAG: IS1634 family transposase [Acidobacteriota bacterium]
MFLRETKRRLSDGSTVSYYQFAENTWDPKTQRPETRIVYNFGRVNEHARERLRRLATSILRRCSPEEVVAAAPSFVLEDAWPHGGLYVLEALWERLGLREVIERCSRQARSRAPLERALFAMVANRSLAPRSKLYCYEQWMREKVYFPAGGGIELHHLYRAMDLLEQHHESIEREVFWRTCDLLTAEVDLIFYDTTSLHFEVAEEDEGERRGSPAAGGRHYPAPRRFGYPKNGRGDVPQIVVGLAVTRDGLPVRCWIFPGNTVDVTTVEQVKTDLRGWQLGRCVFVGDAGMISAENLQILSAGGGRYLLGTKLQAGDEVTKHVVNRPGRYRAVKDNLRVKEVWVPGRRAGERRRRYAVCFNPQEAERQRRHRARVLRLLEVELATLGRGSKEHPKRACELIASQRFGRYLRQLKSGRVRLDRRAVREAARYDGKFVVTTNDDTLSVEDMALGYKHLMRVEQSWRELKSGIRLRPVFHWVAHRIHAHVRLSVLSLLLERVAERACQDTWRNIRDRLDQLKVAVFRTPHGRLVQSSELRPETLNMLNQLKIKPPPTILEAT